MIHIYGCPSTAPSTSSATGFRRPEVLAEGRPRALAPGGSMVLQGSTPIDIDRDYVLQIAHSQIVSTSFSTGAMGQSGSAASAGSVAISFASEPAGPDPDLSIEYAMVDLLGLPAPSLGNPPVSPSVPIGGASAAAVLVLLMTGAAIARLRGRP